MTESCKIGEELLRKILLGLPPKTLTQFKCVANWWYALINNPSFVAKHLSDAVHNKQSTCVFMNRLVPKSVPNNTRDTESVFSVLTFHNVANDDGADGVGVGGVHSFLSGVQDINVPLSMNLKAGDNSLHIVAHCDGIIFLALDDSRKMLLWNPAIQEFKILPSQTYLPDWYSPGGQDCPYCPHQSRLEYAIGFGYDPISEGYKVVNIRFSGSKMHGNNRSVVIYPLLAEVYTLGTDSWRQVNAYSLETETTYLWPERFETHFKGMGYWLGTEQPKEFVDIGQTYFDQDSKIRQVIISFDMSGEVFHAVLLPDELNQFNDFEMPPDMRLMVWNESIALLSIHGRPTNPPASFNRLFGMWLSGGEGVWTKYMAVELDFNLPFERGIYPMQLESLALWKSDEVLMIAGNGYIVCYNLRTKNLKDLPIQSAQRYNPLLIRRRFPTEFRKQNHRPVMYVSSMVPLTGENKLEG